MAVTILQSPAQTTPAFNEHLFLVSSNNNANTNFKVVFYVKNALGTVIYKGKKPCDPTTNKAMLDVGRIVEQLLTWDFNLTNQIAACPGSYMTYTVEFAEEYGTPIVEQAVSATSSTIYCWNAAYLSRSFELYTATEYPITSSAGKFLHQAEIPTTLSTTGFFSALHDVAGYVNTITVVAKDNTGATIQTTTIPYTPTPLNSTTRLLRFPVHPTSLNAITGVTPAKSNPGLPIIPNTTASYTVQWGNALSTFRIKNDSCEGTPITLHWLNTDGGFDSFKFDGRNKRTNDIKTKSYRKSRVSISGSNAVLPTSSGGMIQHHTTVSEKYKLVSNRMLYDYEITYLYPMYGSPVKYAEIGGKLYPIIVEALEKELPNNKFDPPYMAEIDIIMATDHRLQRF